MVVSVSLYHQQCDNSAKYNRKTLIGLEPSFCMWCFIAFLPPGAPSKGVYFTSVTARGPCTVKKMVFGPADLAHYEKFPLHQRHLKTNSWTRDVWMLIGPVAGVTPLARFKKLRSHSSCCSGPLLHNSRCPKPVQISGLGTGTRLSYAHSSKTLLANE